MSEFTFSVTVRVEEGDTPEEYQGDEYALQFATASLARVLALNDARPFSDNAISKLRVHSVSLKAGDKETHHEPPKEHQPEADEPRTLGFTTEEIEAARTRNAEQP